MLDFFPDWHFGRMQGHKVDHLFAEGSRVQVCECIDGSTEVAGFAIYQIWGDLAASPATEFTVSACLTLVVGFLEEGVTVCRIP